MPMQGAQWHLLERARAAAALAAADTTLEVARMHRQKAHAGATAKALFSSCLSAGNPLQCTYRCRTTLSLSHTHPSHPNILSPPPPTPATHPPTPKPTHIGGKTLLHPHHRCPPSPKLPSGSGSVSASSLLSTMLSYSVMSWTTSTSSSRMACAVEMNSAGRTLQARDKQGTAHSSAPANGNSGVTITCTAAEKQSHPDVSWCRPATDQDTNTHGPTPSATHSAKPPQHTHLLGSLRSSMGSPKLGLTLTARLGGRAGMLPAGV